MDLVQLERRDPRYLPRLCSRGDVVLGQYKLIEPITTWPLGERWRAYELQSNFEVEARIILPTLIQTNRERRTFISAMKRSLTQPINIDFQGQKGVAIFKRYQQDVDFNLVADALSNLHRYGVYGLLSPDDLYVFGNWIEAIPLKPLLAAWRYRSSYFSWLAPELLLDGYRFDRRVDIYSLGCLMEYLGPKTHVSHRAKAPHPDQRFDNIAELKQAILQEATCGI